MKGMQIFQHAVRQVMNNLPDALKVSGVLYLVQALIGMALGAHAMGGGMGPASMGAGAIGAGILGFFVTLAAGVWIAVAWHRYVLLAEHPQSVLPPLLGDKMGAYFLKALLIGIALVVLGMVLGMIVGFVAMPLFAAGLGLFGMLVIAALVQVPMIFFGLRLAAALPGAALGVDHGLGAGWEATAEDWKTVLQLSVILAAAMLVLNLVGWLVFGGFGLLAQLWQLIVGWPIMLVGLSVLTTLYGHYIQKRPLV